MPVTQVPSKLAAYTASIVRGLIDQESSLEVHESRDDLNLMLNVYVAPRDVGKVVGARHRTVDAIRLIIYASAKKMGLRHNVVLQVSEQPAL